MGKSSDTPLPLSAPFPNDRLLLSEAILAWSDPTLVEDAKAAERSYSRDRFPIWIKYRMVPDNELRQPTSGARIVGGPYDSGLPEAWAALERSFRVMIANGQLFLEGVLIRPNLTDCYQSIPGNWASNLKLDFLESRISIQDRHYATVRVSREPFPMHVALKAEAATDPLTLTDQQIANLSPEVVATLLERHAEQVRLGLQKTLLAPGKASVIALVASKMKERIRSGKSAIGIKDEALWLKKWAASVAPSWDPPGEKTIANKLGGLFSELTNDKDPSVVIPKAPHGV